MADVTLLGATYPDVPAVDLPSGEGTARFYDPNELTYVESVNGESGAVTLDIPPTMTILSYGNSTWADFEAAYNSNTIVYCRASSNSNPATGSQTRMAFMAYVNNADSPTEVEFQYYRSIASHTTSQQGDQVFVYKLNKTSGWSVTTREACIKIAVGSLLSSSFADNTLTISLGRNTVEVYAADYVLGECFNASSPLSFYYNDDIETGTLSMPAATSSSAGHMTAAQASKLAGLPNIVTCTQAQYDAMASHDTTTLYLIAG